MKALRVGVIIVLVVLLALIAVWTARAFWSPGLDREALARDGIVLLPEPRNIPEITLTSHLNQPFTVGDASGRWSLVFFGYTFCPDICPTTLAELRELMRYLPEEAREQTRVLMVSVDPGRDTPERLKEYMAFFNPDFVGLSGELAQLQALSNAVGVPFIPADTSRENYTVDHSGNLAIINPNGDLHGFIRAPLQVDRLSDSLPVLIESGDVH